MKKTLLLCGLFTTICLTACGSKNFNMSFEEALDSANYSKLQDILAENDNFEQSFKISGNYNSEGNNIDADISSESKQNTINNNSESSTNFDININNEDSGNAKITGVLNIKFIDDTIYLNLGSLDLTGNDNLAMIGMATEGFKGQWLSVPMTGISDMPNTLSYLKDSKKLNSKIKDIVINEGSTVYNGKFSQFNGYNARKISLDNDKINELIKEYYATMNTQDNTGEDNNEIPMINIQKFEGYLVITGKDKVTTVIENMEMIDSDITMNVNGFAGEDYEINISENDKPVIQITAEKKLGKYKISATISDSIYLNGTISPNLSKSGINLDFDATLTIKDETEQKNNVIIPFKGYRKYNSISEFTVSAPEDAQDLNELLGAYLGGMIGGSDYTGDYILDDYSTMYDENSLNLNNIETNSVEIGETKDLENNEDIATNE